MLPSIFKSYDVRGRLPEDWEPGDARRIGKALAQLHKPKRVAIGRDARTTSVAIEEALIDGLTTAGADVVRVGLCSTPMFNFAMGEADGAYDLGVMVTASHNPPAFNGLKIIMGDVLPLGAGSGMEELRDLSVSDQLLPDAPKLGTVSDDQDLLDRYVRYVLSLAHLPKKFPALKLAIDAGNGMAGLTLPKFTKALNGCEITRLYWDVDGAAPHHEANPMKRETLDELCDRVKRDGCDLGIAFDGDADRIGFVDETGEPVPGDLMTAVLAQAMLRHAKKGTVLYDLRSSHSVAEAVREAGGSPDMSRVGHAHIKRLMSETSALFAGELSMHYYFPAMWRAESSELAMLLVISLLISEKKPFSALWKPLQRYAHSGEKNFPVTDPRAGVAALDQHFAPFATERSELDGITLTFRDAANSNKDWWFNARPSNTEPLLRLVVEAKTQEQMQAHLQEVSDVIQALPTPE